MRVNSLIATPVANLIRIAALAEGQGICGLLTPSIKAIPNLSVPSHQLLAHLLKVNITSVPSSLTIHNVTLNTGAITLKKIFKTLRGVKFAETKEISEPLFQATGSVKFSLITGKSLIDKPLTEHLVCEFVEASVVDGLMLISTALPFLAKEPITFEITDASDGTSDITFNRISEVDAQILYNKLIL